MAMLFKRDDAAFTGRQAAGGAAAAATAAAAAALAVPPGELTLPQIVENRLVRAEFQPIVGLDNSGAVAFEAFARGPVGSRYSAPREMFEEAARTGLTRRLDQAAHTAAYRAALDAKLHPSLSLFLNADGHAGFALPDPPEEEPGEEAPQRPNRAAPTSRFRPPASART